MSIAPPREAGQGGGRELAAITAVWYHVPKGKEARASDRSRGKSQISRDFKDKFAENKPI